MGFSIGDKILFKKEKLEGEIVKINSLYKVTVLSADGFEMNVSVKDIVKIEKGTDQASSYGEVLFSKDSDSKVIKVKKKEKRNSVLKVDLHIELLTSNHECMDNFEILQIQLNECHKKIQSALNSSITKIEIIHGIGTGMLKKEVHNILKDYNLRLESLFGFG